MLLQEQRNQLVDYGKRMQADHLTVGTSGNISIRERDLIAITPSGAAYEDLTPESISVIDLAGQQVDGDLEPSSEVPMHTKVYQHTEAAAVVHTHPLYASTLSALVDELPPVHYMVALLGGPVRVAPYATFGSPELAENSVRVMKDRYGVILANHGATTYGDSVGKAYSRSIYLEWVSQMYYQASLLGQPRLLSEEEIDRVGEKLAGYGQSVQQTKA